MLSPAYQEESARIDAAYFWVVARSVPDMTLVEQVYTTKTDALYHIAQSPDRLRYVAVPKGDVTDYPGGVRTKLDAGHYVEGMYVPRPARPEEMVDLRELTRKHGHCGQ